MPAIMRMMNTISRAQAIYRAEALANGELGGCHHSFVLVICHNPGLSQEQLARRICLNKSTVARTLTYLEEKGYVSRKTSETDKRVTMVYPTEKMQAVLPRVQEIAVAWQNALTEGMNEEELAGFLTLLSRMEERAKTQIGGEG